MEPAKTNNPHHPKRIQLDPAPRLGVAPLDNKSIQTKKLPAHGPTRTSLQRSTSGNPGSPLHQAKRKLKGPPGTCITIPKPNHLDRNRKRTGPSPGSRHHAESPSRPTSQNKGSQDHLQKNHRRPPPNPNKTQRRKTRGANSRRDSRTPQPADFPGFHFFFHFDNLTPYPP